MLDNDTPFDLEKVREICIKLTLRSPARELIDDVYQCALAGQVLPSALDEILRLQSNNQEQLKIIECLYKLMHAEAKSYAKLTSLQCNALGVIRDAYEEQAKRIAELESNLIAQKSYVDYWESESDRQHAALKKLGKRSGKRGKALAEALESLEHIECQFFACPGPDEPFEDMATCHRCATIQMIRSQLRQEGKL